MVPICGTEVRTLCRLAIGRRFTGRLARLRVENDSEHERRRDRGVMCVAAFRAKRGKPKRHGASASHDPAAVQARGLLPRLHASLGMRVFCFAIALSSPVLAAPLLAPAQTAAPAAQTPDPRGSICPMIEAVAQTNGLPVDFFARVIWQESRFRPDVIGPLTHSGERALGIAQFMPGTAVERHLFEPFDPLEALPKSGEFLAELRNQFGNLGLAAAAYNAGPQRVRDFITGSRDLPLETRNYVLAITGRPIEDWAKPVKPEANEGNDNPMNRATATCRDVITLVKQAPGPLAELQQRKVPSWCRHLHRPGISVCGSVHEEKPAITISRLRSRGVRPIVRASSR
jgi:Transglycosylase SLT domain